MENITISAAQKLSSPNPFCLVTAIDDKGITNLTAVSWWTYVSNNPPMLAVCLSKKGYSSELINRNKQFSVCLIDMAIADKAMKCGRSTGRLVNKAKDFEIELIDADTIKPAVVKESKVVFECSLVNVVDASDHNIFLGEITAIRGNASVEHVYSLNGYGSLGKI